MRKKASTPSRLLPSLDRLSPAQVPIPLREICFVLKQAGFQAWLVGGAVRDIILARQPIPDWDVATDALPEEIQKLFKRSTPTGIAHGTLTIHHNHYDVEITTFRCDGQYLDGRHPVQVRFGVNLLEDLSRRDFTINSLAYDPLDDHLEDPFSGLTDMQEGIIRTVGEPRLRFGEDGLRPMRACRFAAQLEYALEPDTAAAIPSCLDVFDRVAKERVGDEMDKMLSARLPSIGIDAMHATGILSRVIPELEDCYGVSQNRYHAFDIYNHSTVACDNAPAEKPAVRWAALLHDLGKLPTRRELDNGEATFYDHQLVSARMARTILTRLKRPGELINQVVHLIREHMFAYNSEWTDAAVRRFMRKAGMENLADLFDLRIADWFGNGTHRGFPRYLNVMLKRISIEEAKAAALKVTDLVIDGHNVMAILQIPPSPPIGQCLNWLLDRVLDNPDLNNLDDLTRLAKEWDTSGRPQPEKEESDNQDSPDTF